MTGRDRQAEGNDRLSLWSNLPVETTHVKLLHTGTTCA